MPPKMTLEPLKFFLSDGEKFIELKDLREVSLNTEDDFENAMPLVHDMSPVSITLKLRSGSNYSRMHGKKAFRMRCYHRWKKYEIYRGAANF